MNEYRAYMVGHDGRIKSSRAFVWENNSDAVAWAEQLVDDHDIELWSGERFVKRLNAGSGPGAVSHEVIDGKMVQEARPPQFAPWHRHGTTQRTSA